MKKSSMVVTVAGLILATVAAPQAVADDGEPGHQYVTEPCPGDQQYYPGEDPSRFWGCSDGTAYRFDCPAGLHWDVRLNTCNWPDVAGRVEGDHVPLA
ncbi:carbohydrate-binding module family 14 protein [Streptomyces sp. CB03238]|uniref:carbohydrate-binding module family 14 protein n=1 Tax=Streptomyces sp. CB03238 TaxID=1907777 RepID=UPI000A0FCE39|nr:carbohydrate-binding module family 14 protein [Streptomyces sp. CB03238]